jgi:AcrR family transcriptional regulator
VQPRCVNLDGVQRARSLEAKQQRERAILDAARELAAARTVREVTLTDVAAAVGMHKSAMLRYFETREEIFLALTAEAWVEWSEWIRSNVAEDDAAVGDRPGQGAVAGDGHDRGGRDHGGHDRGAHAATLIARSLAARPLFCDLLAHAPMNLERNVSLDTAYAYKVSTLEQVVLVTDHLRALLGLTQQQARDLVGTATSMAGAFWQMSATSGNQLDQLYAAHPELAHANVEVEPRLTRILAALITGMRVSP